MLVFWYFCSIPSQVPTLQIIPNIIRLPFSLAILYNRKPLNNTFSSLTITSTYSNHCHYHAVLPRPNRTPKHGINKHLWIKWLFERFYTESFEAKSFKNQNHLNWTSFRINGKMIHHIVIVRIRTTKMFNELCYSVFNTNLTLEWWCNNSSIRHSSSDLTPGSVNLSFCQTQTWSSGFYRIGSKRSTETLYRFA